MCSPNFKIKFEVDMSKCKWRKWKYNAKADMFLKKLYDSVGATTWEQKFNTLCLALMSSPESMTFSHNPTWEQKVGMLEYEYLELHDLIELKLA